jgi:nucleoside-diphosphate-sugar epimerase
VGNRDGTKRSDRRYLVTGALGCIGAWTVRALAREGIPVVAFDLATDPRRLELIATPDELRQVTVVKGDITDLESIEHALDEHRITNVIHLAALQVPACRADPPLGARVNVLGTVNVFEAVRRRADRMAHVVYTGSIGMYAASDADPRTGRLEDDAVAHPANHYGVYKLANEGTARVYWSDHGLASIGLRPMTVYGPGRDQGLTSTPTKAIVAAVLEQPYHITFGGRTVFQYAADVAATLVIASRSTLQGANAFNLGGNLAHLDEFVAAIDAAVPGAAERISVADQGLPFPEEISADALSALGPVPVTPLGTGVGETAELFQRLHARGALIAEEQGLEPETAPIRGGAD